MSMSIPSFSLRLLLLAAVVSAVFAAVPALSTSSESGGPVATVAQLPVVGLALEAVAPDAAEAGTFSDYVRCITGAGIPLGVAISLAPYVPAIVWGVIRGIPPGSMVPMAMRGLAQRYGSAVFNSCRRFVKS